MIKKIVVSFIQKFKHFQCNFKWWKDYKRLRKMFVAIPKSFDIMQGHTLILAPHSDDEWIGCSTLIEKMDCTICSMNMRGNNDQEVREKRFNEMLIVAKAYGRELIRLSEYSRENDLRHIIKVIRPTHIALPFFMDWHEEHILTMTILKDIINDYDCSIVMYQVSCPIPAEAINYIVPLSKESFKKKWKTFVESYKTQRFLLWKRFAYIERAQGKFSNTFAANVFCIMDSKTWMNSFFLLMTNEERLEELERLNSIKESSEYLNELWKEKNSVNSASI